jgi:hypothetical protein
MAHEPVDLAELADDNVPELVAPAARRFRRRLFAAVALVALVGGSSGYLVASSPEDGSPRGRLAGAEPRVAVNEQLDGDGLSLLVLEAGRVSEGVYGIHVVGIAHDLDDQAALTLSVPINTLLPAPGEESDDLGGLQVQTDEIEPGDAGMEPGRHVRQAWILLPTGTRTVPIQFAAGIPLAPQGAPDMAEDRTVELEMPDPGQANDAQLALPPTVPGTGQNLGTIELDLRSLAIPPEIWDR